MTDRHHAILIIGGGTAGISVAARLCNLAQPPDVAVVEPSESHYYQPLWTLVGGGVFPREASVRPEAEVMPRGATWIRDHAARFDPDRNLVVTRRGDKLTYDILVVAPGIQLDWGKIAGLPEALGKDGVCSNYAYDTVESTWRSLRSFRGGTAVFTHPAAAIKCGGAPQKIMWLAEHHLRRAGVRDRSEVVFASAGGDIFGVPRYAETLRRLVAERGVIPHYKRDLIEVRPASREALFRSMDGKDELILRYDLLHVTPPMSAPDVIKQSPLADQSGWVDVDKHTLQHVRYPNVFSLGDASSLPCSKTGAAVRKQAPVLVENLLAYRAGAPLRGSYDGYSSCPLVTGYGRLILAEFGYDGKIMETFPVDQSQERYSMWALKLHALPRLYWHGMLRGRA